MEPMVVEVRFQGIVVGRAARARDPSVDGAFVETDAPMPVGAIVTITPESGPGLRTRVARVTEVGDARGMTLSWAGLDEAGRAWLATGLGAPPVDLEPGGAPRAVPAGADDAATQRTEVAPAGAVAEEVAPADEISAPIDVTGAPAEGEGGKKRGKRKRR
jgi:hypothetical protein